MAEKTVRGRLLVRTDTTANWSSANPTLKKNELGFDSTAQKFKIGDGTNAWNSLKYIEKNSDYVNITNGITDKHVEIIKQNAQTPIHYSTHIYTPTYFESDLGDMYYTCFEGDEKTIYVLNIDWNNKIILDEYNYTLPTIPESDFVDVETLPGKAPVPNSGFVDKVYFNTDLSDSEVEALLSTLTYSDKGAAALLVTSNVSKAIMITALEGGYAIFNEQSQAIWCDEKFLEKYGETLGISHSGWHEFANPIEINAEVTSDGTIINMSGVVVGSQNDKLVDLLYVDSDDAELDKIYRVPIKGSKVVPNTGSIEKVYFNTDLSNDEVLAICQKLSYQVFQDEYGNDELPGVVLLNSNGNPISIFKSQNSESYAILGGDFYSVNVEFYWANGDFLDLTGTEEGWQNFTNPITINGELLSTYESAVGIYEVGTQNSKIVELFYTDAQTTGYTYHRQKDGKFIQVLDETLVVDVAELPSPTIYTSTEVPSSGLVEKIYINTELSNDKIFEIFNSLTYVDVYLEGMSIPQIYVVLTDSSMNKAITISAYGGNISYVRDMANNDIVILWSQENGWESTLSELDINVENMLSVFASQLGMELQNNKLTSLFSATPFKKTPNPDIKVDKLYRTPQFSGTEIPSSGAIGTIYFNTDLSVEETVAILETLEYVDAFWDGQLLVPILSNADMTNALFIRKLGDGLYIMVGLVTDTDGNVTTPVIFSSYVEQGYGWLASEFAFNDENMLSVLASQAGVTIQNNKITKLMTLDTFKVSAYDYYQIKNGEWKEFGSNKKSENSGNGVTLIEVDKNVTINDELWNKVVENEVVVLKIVDNSESYDSKIYALKSHSMIYDNGGYVVFQTTAVNGIGTIVVQKDSNGNYFSNFYASDPTDNIKSIGIENNKLVARYDRIFDKDVDYLSEGVNVDTETATDSNNLITSKAVRKYVEDYVAQYMATNNNSSNESEA